MKEVWVDLSCEWTWKSYKNIMNVGAESAGTLDRSIPLQQLRVEADAFVPEAL